MHLDSFCDALISSVSGKTLYFLPKAFLRNEELLLNGI